MPQAVKELSGSNVDSSSRTVPGSEVRYDNANFQVETGKVKINEKKERATEAEEGTVSVAERLTWDTAQYGGMGDRRLGRHVTVRYNTSPHASCKDVWIM